MAEPRPHNPPQALPRWRGGQWVVGGASLTLAITGLAWLVFPAEHTTPTTAAVQLSFDINHVTSQELTLLPGIGPALAQRIVAYRHDHGPFATLDEITNVAGVGPAKLAQMRPFLIEPQPPGLASLTTPQRTDQ